MFWLTNTHKNTKLIIKLKEHKLIDFMLQTVDGPIKPTSFIMVDHPFFYKESKIYPVQKLTRLFPKLYC